MAWATCIAGIVRRGDRLARGVALVVVVWFGIAQVASYVTDHAVPVELYPSFTLALGYLLGYRILKNGEK